MHTEAGKDGAQERRAFLKSTGIGSLAVAVSAYSGVSAVPSAALRSTGGFVRVNGQAMRPNTATGTEITSAT